MKFKPVIDDELVFKNPQKVLFVSGKIYYDLFKARDEHRLKNAAIVRIEQLYPFPKAQLGKVIAKYKKCKNWLWIQEEPENQGPWRFMADKFQKEFSIALTYIGRNPSPSPSTGYHHVFLDEQNKIVRTAIHGR
jgi:2-oxoglutarate dehydrogenase E1 component